jgi:tRNA threonylcarbamoyladenosine biosynthesis protein TsaE
MKGLKTIVEHHLIYDAASESDTAALGATLASVLPDRTVVALCGTLGAGKTRLVQAIAEGCGIDRRAVTSPTFVLVQEYHGRREICHIDAYRLRSEDEFLELGPEEYYQTPGLVLVEWADRVSDFLPKERIEVRIDVTGDTSRRFEVVAHGERYQGVLSSLAARLR